MDAKVLTAHSRREMWSWRQVSSAHWAKTSVFSLTVYAATMDTKMVFVRRQLLNLTKDLVL